MLILLADSFTKDLPERLKKFGEVSTDLARVSEAEIIIVRSKTKVDKAMIDAAPKLKYIIRGGVGVDTIDVDYAKTKNILVDNTPEASSIAVAELALAAILALPNNLVAADNSMKKNQWLKKELERTEVYGKTLGLIGLGRIANELATRARALGMKVIAYDSNVKDSTVAEIVNVETVVQADFVSLHVPLTDATKGMINKQFLSKFKKGAYLINTCRGQVIIEEDVVAALNDGTLAGYAGDVFYKEPPEGSPLLTAPNTLLTPHLGASTAENLLRLADCIVDRVQKYIK